MNEKNKVFKKLLPIEELFLLYTRLSETIITKIDVKNLDFDSIAIDNSIDLFHEVGIMQFDENKKIFQKTMTEKLTFYDFSKILYERLRSLYPDAFLFFNQTDLKYDETEAKLYIKRNSVSLDFSGLLMLLDGIGKLKIRGNDIFILDKSLLDCRKNRSISFHHRTLAELKNQIEINEEFGIEAELVAMRYETDFLKNIGIDKLPERISEYNTSAGYDIVSFMHIDSLVADKFIEVKSCSDDSWIFYISKNELTVARGKQDNYYLYLYNRENHKFRIIQNPYKFFFEGEGKNQWIMDPQIYQVKSLEKLS